MKLLHKVVKSSQGLNFDGEVSIDNTVVIKPRISNNFDNDIQGEEFPEIGNEVRIRVAAFQQELAKKERQRLDEINTEKSKIITEAMTEADRIRRDAETSAYIMKEQGRQEGFDAGRRDAIAEISSSIKAATELLSEIKSQKEAIYIANENELIDLAYEMVKKITYSELKSDRQIIFGIIKQACKSFRSSDYVKISVAKCDVSETVVTDENLLKKIAGNIPDVELELLPDAESGTVILDNDSEIIDASVPTQLEFLREVMNSGKKPNV